MNVKKILVIEDDVSIQSTIFEFLQTEGYEVYLAMNGKQGIQIAQSVTPDIIICDIMMPEMDGYEVLNNLSSSNITAPIPFIFLSARSEKPEVRHGMDMGADDYLTKPFKLDDLLHAVQSRLKKSEMMKKNCPQQTEDNNTAKNKLGIDDHVMLSINDQPLFFPLAEIECITAEAEYTYVHSVSGQKMLVRKLLKEWESILPGNFFIRIHRSTIINIKSVNKIDKWFNHSLAVSLKHNNEKFVISRRYYSKLKNKMDF
ncbi:MAG: response regulator [Ignavibacteriales bacterium]|nr:MAG: response regulator [Ignavibacteriales bacterium]